MIETYAKSEMEDILMNHYIESTVMRGKVVKSAVGSVSKRERCKQYYRDNREKHLTYAKNMFHKKR